MKKTVNLTGPFLKAQLPPFGAGRDMLTAPLLEYLRFYGMEFPDFRHTFGLLDTGQTRISLHLYSPAEPSGVTILVHGYLDHCGTMMHLISHLLLKNCAVAVFDMRGHGLSDGERTAVNDFAEYAADLRAVTAQVSSLTGFKPDIVGFSTGCAAILEHLYLFGDPYRHIVLACPLVRTVFYDSIRFTDPIGSAVVKTIPRVFRATSHDKKFLEFTEKRDFLQDHMLSLSWSHAMVEWNARNVDYPGNKRPLTLIEAEKDQVVENTYNREYLAARFPQLTRLTIPEAYHQVYNEKKDILEKALELTGSGLGLK